MQQLSDYDYDLPKSLIAQYPLKNRRDSRLLRLDGQTNQIIDDQFKHFIDFIMPNDLLVFNNTKVMKARLFGHKKTGGKVQILIERILTPHTALAHIKANKSPKIDAEMIFNEQIIRVTQRHDALFEISCSADLYQMMENNGHIPLPPYIQRADATDDLSRYQTVYAEKQGAVAAPTAGLHFDDQLLKQIQQKKVKTSTLTLHVGAGTFQPVKTNNLDDHQMHAEWIDVDAALCQAVEDCRARNGRVIAIGTTAVRGLESASQNGQIEPYQGDTRLFIRSGYQFKSVDLMLTNFHLPQSTLLMLVAAFSGYDEIFNAYQHAIARQYRFFSYGDAMLLSPKKENK